MRRIRTFSLALCVFILVIVFPGCSGPVQTTPDTPPAGPETATTPPEIPPVEAEPPALTPPDTPVEEPESPALTPPDTVQPTTAPPPEPPVVYADIVFINGKVITMETANPQAEALAVLGDLILKVGTNTDIEQYISGTTKVIDLQGKTLLPGFVDPHTHRFGQAERVGGWFQRTQELALSQGITTLADMFVNPTFLELLQDFEQQGSLDVRTSVYLPYNAACGDIWTILGTWYQEHGPNRDPSSMLRILGVKVFSDGGSCHRPALSMDLPPEVRDQGAQGDLFVSGAELSAIMEEAQAAGFQVAVHAIGDRAIDAVLDAFESVLGSQPNTNRHRIEHNTHIRPDQLDRYAEPGPVVTLFPPLSFALLSPEWYWAAFLNLHGPSVYSWTQPYRSLLDANPGLHAAWHSDWPSTEWTPISHLWGMTTRKQVTPDGVSVYTPPDWATSQALTVEEVLRMMTIDAAYVLFMEDRVGSLMPGKYADLVVLSGNPLEVALDDILDLKVLLTMVGGEVKFSVPGLEAANAVGSISGRVYQADGVTPIAGADVQVLDSGLWDNIWICRGRATTDDQGFYRIEGLDTGIYFAYAIASGDGFAPEIYPESPITADRATLYVTPMSELEDIDFTLEQGGRISGRITTLDNGAPVPVSGVHVVATNTATGHWGEAFSDGNGNWTIAVMDGEYLVMALPPTRALPYQPQYYNLATYYSGASTVSVTTGQGMQGINFVLEPAVFADGG